MRTHSLQAIFATGAVAAALVACSGAVTLGENQSNSPTDARGAKSDGPPAGETDPRPDATASSDASDAGDAKVTDDAAACGGCASGKICVAHRSVGGALFLPDDAGACPSGRHPEALSGGTVICQNDWTFSCEAPPSGCGATIDCSCAQTYCSDHDFGSACSVGTGSGAKLECTFLAP